MPAGSHSWIGKQDQKTNLGWDGVGMAKRMKKNQTSTGSAPEAPKDAERVKTVRPAGLPAAQGLYDSANEHDACGIGFVANIHNRKSHDMIANGLKILENLEHRGAVGADPKAGDGAGILIQMPDAFMRKAAKAEQIDLPEEGAYGVGFFFLPKDDAGRAKIEALIEDMIAAEGQTLLGWRDVPVDNSDLGYSVLPTEPFHRQVFIARGANTADQDAFERKLYVIRKRVELGVSTMGDDEAASFFYVPSFSSRTVNYKGMLLAAQVGQYYKDLQDKEMVSALALFNEHVPHMEPGAPVPADLSQWRDQHQARQRKLDVCAPGLNGVRHSGRRSEKALSSHPRRSVRHSRVR